MFRKRKPRPKRDEVWSEFAVRHAGVVELTKRGRVKRVRLPTGPWTTVLETYAQSSGNHSETYTRFRALYRVRDEFRFRIHRRTAFSGIGKFFGMQDIEVGNPAIDRDWIIRADSEGRARSLLILPEVARALASVKSGRFESRPYRKRGVRAPDVRELRLQVPGEVKDVERLDAGLALFAASLDRLVRIGAAQPEPPAVEL